MQEGAKKFLAKIILELNYIFKYEVLGTVNGYFG